MVLTSELRVGSVFKYSNEIVVVQRLNGNKSGRGAQVSRFRVKNLLTGQTSDVALNAGDKFDEVDLDQKSVKLSYIDGENYVFMDNETFDQIEIIKDDLGDNAGYIMPEDDIDVEITFYEGKPIGMKLPLAITRTIEYCEPGIKGDTSGKSLKPAKLDSGIEIGVPLFCDIGTKIKVDTRDGSFMERVK